jgi:hypothetical protein
MWMENTCKDLETVIDALHERVPFKGRCSSPNRANKNLDRFRRAQNVIHDIFNNGLMNRGRELKVLNITKSKLGLTYNMDSKDWDAVENRIADTFRAIVMDAVLEQFGRDVYLKVMHNHSSAIINKAIEEGRV